MISFIITGYRQKYLKDHATPLIRQVRQYEPDIEIILADCNSYPPYKPSDDYRLLKIPKPFNIPTMYNMSLREAQGDWFALSNDDVKCWGPFSQRIESMNPEKLYTNELAIKYIEPHHVKTMVMHGWLIIMHRELYQRMGEFDETLPVNGVDLEYSLRAVGMGIEIVPLNLPLKHLHHHRRG